MLPNYGKLICRQVPHLGGTRIAGLVPRENACDCTALAALLWLSLRLPTHSALTKRKFAAPHKTSRLATSPTKLPDHSCIVDQQDNTAKMGRLHSKGKGISASAIPYSRAAPAWLKTTPEQVVEQICKLARKGATPSQIGVILRDSHGVAQVKIVTGTS